MTSSAEHEARAALLLAESDPRRAADVARNAAEAARRSRDVGAQSVAARAMGLAHFYLHDVDAALAEIRRAVALGERAGSPRHAGEARMTLAYVLNWRGKPSLALRTIDAAVAELHGVERARAQAQRGTIRHQQGRFDEALVDYEVALTALKRAGDDQWVARILANRGNGFAHRSDFAAATSDLLAAKQAYDRLGLDLSVGLADHNLGYLEVLRGDIPAALGYFDEAERRFVKLGSQLGPLLRDRAELLLSANLIGEAREAAQRAVEVCLVERRQAILPEARLLLARAEQLHGELREAMAQTRQAARELDRLGHAELAALARLILLTLRVVGDARLPDSATLEAAAAATGGLWPHVPMEARIRAAEAALRGRNTEHAVELLNGASRSRGRGTATLRARAWYAEALLRRVRGNTAGAQAAARRGLQILDDYAAALGATEVRARVATHRVDLAVLGLRIAIEQRSARQALRWAELGRASHLHRAPGRPGADPELAKTLTELRIVLHDMEDARAAGRLSASLEARQLSLERQVRDHVRRQRAVGTPVLTAVPVQELTAALGEAALVEYIGLDDALHAISVVDGRTRMHYLGPRRPILQLAERLPFALHRLTRHSASATSREAAADLLRTTAGQLDAHVLRRIPGLGDRPLVIIPTSSLQWLPWSVLPSSAGRPVTVSPSATLWQAAQCRDAAPGYVLVAAGPGLRGATGEAEAVASVHGVAPLVGEAATVGAVADRLSGAALAHLATHGRVRADNPLFGSLAFADGPLMIYDLEKLGRPPHTLVVAACDTGRPVVPAGDELLGLTATLLSMGTTQLIASVLPVLDLQTGPLMTALHGAIASGQSPAEALAGVQQQTAAEGPSGVATAAGFVCFGAGFARPPVGTAMPAN